MIESKCLTLLPQHGLIVTDLHEDGHGNVNLQVKTLLTHFWTVSATSFPTCLTLLKVELKAIFYLVLLSSGR